MDKSLKAAHMTCTDYRVAARLTEAEMQLASFLEMLQGPHPEDFEQLAKIEGSSRLDSRLCDEVLRHYRSVSKPRFEGLRL
jgi:hypothetical protein